MATVNERVMDLEHKAQEYSQSFQLLREDVKGVTLRMDGLDQRMDRLDQRMDRLEQRFDRLEDKVDRGFVWLVGLQVGTLAAVVTGFIAVIDQVVRR